MSRDGARSDRPELGLALDLHPGDLRPDTLGLGRATTAGLIPDLRALELRWLRLRLPCPRPGAPSASLEGRALAGLLARLTAELEVVLCLRAGPTTRPGDYIERVRVALASAPPRLAAVELAPPWVRTLDEPGGAWAGAVRAAAAQVRAAGFPVALGGLRPAHLELLERAAPAAPCPLPAAWHEVAALSLEADARTPQPELLALLARLRAWLAQGGAGATSPQVWLTRAARGPREGVAPVRALLEAQGAPVDRLFWRDEAGDGDLLAGALRREDGAPTLLHALLREGRLSSWGELFARAERAPAADGPARRAALVTGGAGFVGSNLVARLLGEGWAVTVLDDLSRAGVEANARWLLAHPRADALRLVLGDVRDAATVRAAMRGCEVVYHLAAQVAVTTSLEHPTVDFEVNALGTQRVLEAARAQPRPPAVIYTSTNKVYGALGDLELVEEATRWAPRPAQSGGVDEGRPLDLYSPYGCSKGAADQYVLDYARSFGLRAVVLRMSCIYGPRQFGNADQGWLCQFLLCALRGRPLTIYGDGKQVRDALFVDDLVDALGLARERVDALSGRAFNIGGGPARALSLLELLAELETLHGARPPVRYAPWRTGDQRWFVADTARFARATGWRPQVSLRDGLRRLYGWTRELSSPAAPALAPTGLAA